MQEVEIVGSGLRLIEHVTGRLTSGREITRTPRSWVELAYPTLTYFNKVDKGGHFAAWEEPKLFSTEVRATLRSLR